MRCAGVGPDGADGLHLLDRPIVLARIVEHDAGEQPNARRRRRTETQRLLDCRDRFRRLAREGQESSRASQGPLGHAERG